MGSFREAFPSRYLKADDLGVTRPIVTIASVAYEDIGMGAKKESKLVASWAEPVKPLVLNMVNCESIAEIAHTEDTDGWVGVRIQLYATKTEFQGKRVPCIRLCAPPAAVAPKPRPRVAVAPPVVMPPVPDKDEGVAFNPDDYDGQETEVVR